MRIDQSPRIEQSNMIIAHSPSDPEIFKKLTSHLNGTEPFLNNLHVSQLKNVFPLIILPRQRKLGNVTKFEVGEA